MILESHLVSIATDICKKVLSLENHASGAIDVIGWRNATDIFEGGTKSRNLAIVATAVDAIDLFELGAKYTNLKGIYTLHVYLLVQESHFCLLNVN